VTFMPPSRRLVLLLLVSLSLLALQRANVKGYATSGHTWGTNQVFYYVNTNSISLSPSAAVSGIQSGALIWSAQSLANIQLVYTGSTNGTSLTLNNKNEVFFRNDTGGYLAETYWWYDASNHLVDADVVFHEGGNRYYSGSGCSGTGVYVEDVAGHEFGHALGLEHSTVAGATMQPAIPSYCDLTETTLESDDISGIESLYPPTSTSRNTAPSVAISSPSQGSSFSNGTAITFSGSATDKQDGDMSGSLAWTSSIDGLLGYGSTLIRALSSGTHTITASVRDSGGISGSAQITVSVAGGSVSASPDGTIVPTTATRIVDNTGAVWTIGAANAILRNGVQAAGGWGTQILWKSSAISVFGTDGNWWQWNGSGWIKAVQGAASTSPDGTIVPTTATQIVDNTGAVWTIGATSVILRNGVQAAGGWGTQILWKSGTISVFGTDGNWWQWNGSGWIKAVQGATGTSPDGTVVPTTATQIVDNTGAVWTIGAANAILRNGVQAAGGWGTQILWKSSTINVLGTDGSWWQWNGFGWIKTQSGTGTSPDGTIVPTSATQIVDNSGAIWSIGGANTILRNGVQAAGGWGTQILWKSSTIYVFGIDGNWWRWTGSSWVNVGPNRP